MLNDIMREIKRTQVLVFAGGMAKRMGYLDKPKALLEVNGKPLIDHTLEMCTGCGFEDFVFLLGHKSEDIISHLKKWEGKINMRYSVESEHIKGKGKAFKFALENGKIDRNRRSLVVFPDDLVLDPTLPLQALLHHLTGVRSFGIKATIVFTTGTEYPFGVGEIDSYGIVYDFVEKPFIEKPTSIGMYLLEPYVYELVDKKIDLNASNGVEFESMILPVLAEEKALYSFLIPPNLWIPVNTIKEYELANKVMKRLEENKEEEKE